MKNISAYQVSIIYNESIKDLLKCVPTTPIENYDCGFYDALDKLVSMVSNKINKLPDV